MPASRSSASESPLKRPSVALLIVLLVAALALGPPTILTAADAPVVAAANGTLTSGVPGPGVVLPVEVTDVQGLGAATVLVGYDPALIKAVACQRGPRFDVGVCNPNHDRDADGTPDAVKFAVLSLNGVSTTGAPIILANITWQAVVAVETNQVTILAVQVQTFADADGKQLAYTTQNGQITLVPAPPPTITLTPTPTAREQRIYLPLVWRTP